MAEVNSRSFWNSADHYFLETLKETNYSNRKHQSYSSNQQTKNDGDSEGSHSDAGLYLAVPPEFRPGRKDVSFIRTSQNTKTTQVMSTENQDSGDEMEELKQNMNENNCFFDPFMAKNYPKTNEHFVNYEGDIEPVLSSLEKTNLNSSSMQNKCSISTRNTALKDSPNLRTDRTESKQIENMNSSLTRTNVIQIKERNQTNISPKTDIFPTEKPKLSFNNQIESSKSIISSPITWNTQQKLNTNSFSFDLCDSNPNSELGHSFQTKYFKEGNASSISEHNYYADNKISELNNCNQRRCLSKSKIKNNLSTSTANSKIHPKEHLINTQEKKGIVTYRADSNIRDIPVKNSKRQVAQYNSATEISSNQRTISKELCYFNKSKKVVNKTNFHCPMKKDCEITYEILRYDDKPVPKVTTNGLEITYEYISKEKITARRTECSSKSENENKLYYRSPNEKYFIHKSKDINDITRYPEMVEFNLNRSMKELNNEEKISWNILPSSDSKIIGQVSESYMNNLGNISISEVNYDTLAITESENDDNAVQQKAKLSKEVAVVVSPNEPAETSVEKDNERLIYYGKEMSDLIIGSQRALEIFLSIYYEWKEVRLNTIKFFEELIRNIKDSPTPNSKLASFSKVLNISSQVFGAIPGNHFAAAGRIVSIISTLLSSYFKPSDDAVIKKNNDFQIMQCVHEDIRMTSEMHLYGVQCSQQFEETRKVVEEFHETISTCYAKDVARNNGLSNFIREIVEIKPKHCIFYKRLERNYSSLKNNAVSNIERAFVAAFDDCPEAIRIINLLDWQFGLENMDENYLQDIWQDIKNILSNKISDAKIDIVDVLQKCVIEMTKQRKAMHRIMSKLEMPSGH